MAVAEGIPLAQPHNRLQRVVLKQEDAPGANPGNPLGQRRRLIRGMHHAEGVDDDVPGSAVDDG